MKWSNVLKIINGKNQRNVERIDGRYPIYGSGGVMGYATDYLCPAETVVIGRKGTINRPIFVETEFWNVDTAFGLVSDSTVLLPKYLYYFCRSFNFESLNTTVTIPSLTKANLQDIDMNVPSLDIQTKAVSSLDAVSEVLRLRKAQLAELDNLVKSQFVEMFGDVVVNDSQWEYEPLGDFAEVGSSKRIFEREYTIDGVPFYRTKEIVDLSQGRSIETALFISVERFDEICSNFDVPTKGDLLISAVGTIGTIWVVDTDKPFYFKDGNLLWVKETTRATSCYLKHVLEKLITYHIDFLTVGSAYSALTIIKLKQMWIPIPPLPLQNQFAYFVLQIDQQKQSIQQSLDETQRLFDSLMAEYFEA